MPKGDLVLGKTDAGILSLDLNNLIQTRMLIQASSGNGKSMTLRRILEITHGRIPQIVLDYEGEFSTLREKFDYILIGKDGDYPAIPAHAGILARRILELNASIIVDLFELQPAERHLFVKLFIEGLMNAPKELWGPRLVVLDEAHVFCPEKGEGSSDAKGAVADLLSRGRKRGLGTILATQRLAKLSKDAAAECGNKLIGGTNYADDRERAAKELGLSHKDAGTLLTLEPGQFMAIGRALSKSVVQVEIEKATTTHPEAGKSQKNRVPAPTSQVKAVLAKLGDLPKEAAGEIKDLQQAKAEIQTLRRENAGLKKDMGEVGDQINDLNAQIYRLHKNGPAKITTIKVPAIGARTIKKLEKSLKAAKKIQDRAYAASNDLMGAAAILGGNMAELAGSIRKATEKPSEWSPVLLPPQELKLAKLPPEAFKKQIVKIPVHGSLPKLSDIQLPGESNGMGGERKILQALSSYVGMKKGPIETATKENSSIDKADLGVIAGQSHTSGTFATYLSRLKGRGFIQVESGLVILMTKGFAEVANDSVSISPSTLRELWHSKLGGERNLLKIIIEQRMVTRLELGELAGMSSASGTFATYVSRLKGKGLIRLDTVSKYLIPNPLLEG